MIRLENAKTTQLPGLAARRRFAVDATAGASWMVDERGVRHTIDPLKPETLPYEVKVLDGPMPGFHHKSRQSGEFTVRLRQAYSGRNLVTPSFRDPVEVGNRTVWRDFYPGVDVMLIKGLTRVSLVRLLKTPEAPLVYDVDIEQYPGIARVGALRPAHDARYQVLPMRSELLPGGRKEILVLDKPVQYPIRDSVEVDEQVGAPKDDAQERGDGTFQPDQDYNIIRSNTDPGSNNYICIGGRFQTVAIPNGATIDAATSDLYALWDYDANCKIYLNDVDDAADFDAEADIIGRAKTDAFTSWVADAVGSGWQTSPDFAPAVKEVIDRGGWATGQDLVVLFIANTDAVKTLTCRSYEYDDNTLGMKLHVEYTAAPPARVRGWWSK